MTREEILSIAKPILFNTEMVRAIQGGVKFVTRRKVKPQPPKEAARIFLRVTDVRVERLQDITDEQAICEGCNGVFCGNGANIGNGWKVTPVDEYIPLWNSTVKKSDLAIYGWDANPWVWVVSFEKVEVE